MTPLTASPASTRPEWRAFLELGFRPLYLLATLWGAASIALWLYTPGWLANTAIPSLYWHAHEMLWAFIGTIAVGFLLTASATWTGQPTLRGPSLGALCLIWILARFSFLLPNGAIAALLLDALFFVIAAAELARVILIARNKRNYGIPVAMLALGLSHALFMYSLIQGQDPMPYFYSGFWTMGLITLLIARRIIPFFAMRALPGLSLPAQTRSGHWQMGLSAIAIVLSLTPWRLPLAIILAALGLIACFQWCRWQPWASRNTPLLWILYLGYAGLAIGLLSAAAYEAGWILRAAWPVHIVGLAGFSIMIIGMLTRTALGHLGRPLRATPKVVLGYGLLIAACVLRLLALIPSSWSLPLLHAAGLCWILAMLNYLHQFAPMLIRPRMN
ncbi:MULTISPECIES: NnrS family protein [Alcaligenes]|uniref:NnrS family protein n=1 Tax=Alcaligenes parafaecalis TaxID=171260 RepID=A0ABT3VKM1_9BURK|nr:MULTISPECIES: NnrS family protein [Alcaligenes]MCX5463034.1 NnrS family protein [Alcaligenes parafaecalis]QTC00456.1 NnrS family protein [Alcaligenes sp. SORT26]